MSPPKSRRLFRWPHHWPIDLGKVRKWEPNQPQAATATGGDDLWPSVLSGTQSNPTGGAIKHYTELPS